EIADVEAQSTAFERLATYQENFGGTIRTDLMPDVVDFSQVSADFFPMMGVRPLLGRTITAADEQGGGQRVAVLSYRFWQEDFGGDANVLTRVFHADGTPYRVIGVMPRIRSGCRWQGVLEAFDARSEDRIESRCRRQAVFHRRAVEKGRHPEASPRAIADNFGAPRRRISENGKRSRSRGGEHKGPAGYASACGTSDSTGCGGIRTADRVRERERSSGGPRVDAAARNGDSAGTWRDADAAGAADAFRKCAAGDCRRCARIALRSFEHWRDSRDCPAVYAAHRTGSA